MPPFHRCVMADQHLEAHVQCNAQNLMHAPRSPHLHARDPSYLYSFIHADEDIRLDAFAVARIHCLSRLPADIMYDLEILSLTVNAFRRVCNGRLQSTATDKAWHGSLWVCWLGLLRVHDCSRVSVSLVTGLMPVSG